MNLPKNRSLAGLLYGYDPDSLDLLAPLCSLLSIPLFISDVTIHKLAREYYPDLKIEISPPLTFGKDFLSQHDIAITCIPKTLLDQLFFFDEHQLKKKCLSLFLSSGKPSDGRENLFLVPGKQLQGASTKEKSIPIGIYRYYYYEKHRQFYQKLLEPTLKFPVKQKNLLLSLSNSELETTLLALLRTLPPYYNLYIRITPHPIENSFYQAIGQKYARHTNIKFVDAIPPLHPILDRSDFFIGNQTDAAYEFLHYDRPLFFLHSENTPLHHAGKQLTIDSLFDELEREDHYTQARRDIYNYYYDSIVPESLINRIQTAIINYLDDELHLL